MEEEVWKEGGKKERVEVRGGSSNTQDETTTAGDDVGGV